MKSVLCGFLILFATTAAHAGFLIEPGVTYEKGDNELAWPAPLSTSTGDSSGMGVDLKIGWKFDYLLYLALDGAYSKPTFKNSAVSYSASATSTLYSALLGVDLPLGFRVWGGYVFDGALDPEASNGYDVSFKKANGLKLGAGWTFLLVSFNLEYMDLQYNDSKLDQALGVNVNTDFSENLKNKLYVLSVSIPIQL